MLPATYYIPHPVPALLLPPRCPIPSYHLPPTTTHPSIPHLPACIASVGGNYFWAQTFPYPRQNYMGTFHHSVSNVAWTDRLRFLEDGSFLVETSALRLTFVV